MEQVAYGVDHVGRPQVIYSTRNGSRLPVPFKGRSHGRAEQVLPADNEGMVVGVDRFHIGRNKDPRWKRRRLVVAAENHGEPRLICQTVDVLSLDQVEHEGITIVVVTRVNVIQPGHPTGFVGGAQVPAVPLRDHVHPIRIGKHKQKDGVVENLTDVEVFRCHQVIGQLHVVLCRGNLGGMETAINIHDRLPLGCEPVGFLVGQPFASASLFAISLKRSNLAMFSAEVMTA